MDDKTTFKNYREESRLQYGREMDPDQGLSVEQLNCGSILRIADAVETMAKDRKELEKRAEKFKKRYFRANDLLSKKRQQLTTVKKSRAAYIGLYEKAKKRVEELEKKLAETEIQMVDG